MKLLSTRDGLPRLSWGTVIAGVILSMIVYLVMSVLGTAIGASLLTPMSKPRPLEGFGFGSGVWMILTTVLAVFVGSYFAGRCAPVLGWLHGLLAWAVMTLLVVYGMTAIVTGAVSTVGSVAATGAQVGATAANRTDAGNPSIDSARQQVQSAVASATSFASSPDAEPQARQAADQAARGVARASWYSFAALIVGAIIAIVSGSAGFKHQPPFEEPGGPEGIRCLNGADTHSRDIPLDIVSGDTRRLTWWRRSSGRRRRVPCTRLPALEEEQTVARLTGNRYGVKLHRSI